MAARPDRPDLLKRRLCGLQRRRLSLPRGIGMVLGLALVVAAVLLGQGGLTLQSRRAQHLNLAACSGTCPPHMHAHL